MIALRPRKGVAPVIKSVLLEQTTGGFDMLLVYLLIFLTPVFVILIVMFAIGLAGVKTARTGKRAYDDLRPYIDNLKENVTRAQQKGTDFSNRGNNLSKSFEEIAGRWAFIGQTLQETTKSPVIRLANLAGRLASDNRGKG
jgi:hypothetical protein